MNGQSARLFICSRVKIRLIYLSATLSMWVDHEGKQAVFDCPFIMLVSKGDIAEEKTLNSQERENIERDFSVEFNSNKNLTRLSTSNKPDQDSFLTEGNSGKLRQAGFKIALKKNCLG